MEPKRCVMCTKPAQSARSKYCGNACRQRAYRQPKNIVDLRGSDQPQQDLSVYAATKAKLEAAGRLDDPVGLAALVLAGRIDANVDLGSAMSTMTKQLEASMATALEGVRVSDDGVDELRAWAEKRKLRLAGS